MESEGRPLLAPGWLPAKVAVGGWLGGVLLLGQNELASFSDMQNVLLPFVQQNDLTLSLHKVYGLNPPPV
jgi:hypothetical protein